MNVKSARTVNDGKIYFAKDNQPFYDINLVQQHNYSLINWKQFSNSGYHIIFHQPESMPKWVKIDKTNNEPKVESILPINNKNNTIDYFYHKLVDEGFMLWIPHNKWIKKFVTLTSYLTEKDKFVVNHVATGLNYMKPFYMEVYNIPNIKRKYKSEIEQIEKQKKDLDEIISALNEGILKLEKIENCFKQLRRKDKNIAL